MKSKRQHHKKGSTQRSTGVTAKKHLGQHFLTDNSIARRIAETLPESGLENLLEIGPGTGVLTGFLLEYPIHLKAVELDPESVHYLNTAFSLNHSQNKLPYKSFEVISGDFLQMPVDSLFDGAEFGITGNFPYNISTQIVFRVLEFRDRIPFFSGMFQKEVAQRICAGPGSKTYGILSVLTQAYYDAEYCFTVPPEVFDPPPKVDSGVLRLYRKNQIDIDWDQKALFHVVKTAFNQRRKTLRNSLKSLGISDNITEDSIFDRRPEQLSVPEFIALTKRIAHDTV